LEFFGETYEIERLIKELLADKPFFDQSGGGVTLSGGECLAQGGFAVELAKELFARGVRVNVDTCGFVSREILTRILPYTDVFLYDVKAVDGELHKRLTGQDNALILQNLHYLTECGARVEVRVPLVVGENDGEIERIGKFLKSLKNSPRVKVLQYHDFSASRYEALGMENTLHTSKTSISDVKNAVRILRGYGLQVVTE
jgi:pyruvate formate lyase activating enzyme